MGSSFGQDTERSTNAYFLLYGTCRSRALFTDQYKEKRRSGYRFGLQHGFQQWWDGYNSNWDFDYFGTFGDLYVDKFSAHLKDFIVPMGFPALDGVEFSSKVGGRGYILFAAQSEPSVSEVCVLLDKLGRLYGLDVIIKPHPELVDVFSNLRDKFSFSDDGSLESCLKDASIVLSTGSTAVLYALVSGKKTIVIPVQSGELFRELGIVLSNFSDETIGDIISYQETAEFCKKREKFLIEATGSFSSDRTQRAITMFFRTF